LTATPVVEVLERILFGGKYTLPPAVVEAAPERVAAYAGQWRLPKGGALTLAVDGKALSIQPSSAEAFAALAPASPGQAARLAEISARTADVSSRAFKGDVSGLHEAMGGQMPIEEMRSQGTNMMRDREARLGKFLGSAVLGVMPRDEDTAQAFVRLDFEKGSVYNVYVWGPRRILGIRGMPELPALRYLATADREFVAFSLEAGGIERRLSFVEREGETRLMLGPAATAIEAVRQK
jgi:hypothetical protein